MLRKLGRVSLRSEVYMEKARASPAPPSTALQPRRHDFLAIVVSQARCRSHRTPKYYTSPGLSRK